MSFFHFVVGRRVFVTMLAFILVVLGIYAYFGLPVELMPDVEFPVVAVVTTYPGAGPEEVETQISE